MKFTELLQITQDVSHSYLSFQHLSFLPPGKTFPSSHHNSLTRVSFFPGYRHRHWVRLKWISSLSHPENTGNRKNKSWILPHCETGMPGLRKSAVAVISSHWEEPSWENQRWKVESRKVEGCERDEKFDYQYSDFMSTHCWHLSIFCQKS